MDVKSQLRWSRRREKFLSRSQEMIFLRSSPSIQFMIGTQNKRACLQKQRIPSLIRCSTAIMELSLHTDKLVQVKLGPLVVFLKTPSWKASCQDHSNQFSKKLKWTLPKSFWCALHILRYIMRKSEISSSKMARKNWSLKIKIPESMSRICRLLLSRRHRT